MVWKNLLEWIGYLFRHKETTEKNTSDVKTLREDFDDMANTMRQMAFELVRLRENEAHEREKLALRLELLLSNERRLPSDGTKPEIDREELLRVIEDLRREIAELRKGEETRKLE